jgi:hypothetical protein
MYIVQMVLIFLKHRLVCATNVSSSDYSPYSVLTIWVPVVIVCADVYTEVTSRRYQFIARTIFQTAKEQYILCFGSAD